MTPPMQAMAERLAAGHYYVHAKPEVVEQYAWSDYPGRALMIADAARWLEAARYCGLALVEEDCGR